MSNKAVAFLLLSISINLYSQDISEFERKLNETKEEYVLRIKSPEDQLTYQVIESYEWDQLNPSIICFYEIPREKDNQSEIIGHVYMKQYDVDYYRDIVFGDFSGDFYYPEILDMFWLNIDDDITNEFYVLYKYYIYHYDFTGYIYNTAVFDDPKIVDGSLSLIEKYNNEFISFEGMSGDGIESFPLYTTKEEVMKKVFEDREQRE
jgi:hypothetical protein